MHFYLIIALQGFCVYHLYKNRNDYYWIFIIIFLPVLGSIIYLITQVYNKRDAEKVTNEIVTLINPSKKVKDLEKRLQFSETFQNRVDLADAYFEIRDYQNAIKHYQNALNSDHNNDFYVIKSLVAAYTKIESYNEVIKCAEKIVDHPEFEKSKTQFFYGLALNNVGQFDTAETQLKSIDIRYSNYAERLVFAKLLIDKSKTDDAKEILNEIYSESKHMTKLNKRKYRDTITEVEGLLKKI